MVTSGATSAFFSVASSSQDSAPKNNKFGNVSILGIKSKPASGGLQVKVNAQVPTKINGCKDNFPEKNHKTGDDTSSVAPTTFINQLPDWSMILAAISTMFLAAEKQWLMLDWKPKRPDMLMDPFGLGKIVQDGLVYRQNFLIQSYEISPDRTASIDTIMNHFQETALNHCKSLGLFGDGFGSTPQMFKRNLIWVVARMQVLFDHYPTWGDVVQVNTYVTASGKNGMRRDWLVRDSKTGEILTRASSVWVMMNKLTRKLSKIPEEVREEIEPVFINSVPAVVEDSKKLRKLDNNTADYVKTNLTPKWSDLDVNLHVNNVKYIDWIFESAPSPLPESHQLAAMTLEYRKECGKDDVLKSLTTVSDPSIGNFGKSSEVECQHLLQLEKGTEVMRGRTEWRPKIVDNFGNVGNVSTESA